MSTILAFVIGLLFVGFGAVNTGVHSYQVRTLEAKRARYGALEDAIANEQSASFESSDDAQGANQRNDEKARNQAVYARTAHSKNATAARLTLGTHSSNAEAEERLEILSKHGTDDMNVAVGIALLLGWLALTLLDAASSHPATL